MLFPLLAALRKPQEGAGENSTPAAGTARSPVCHPGGEPLREDGIGMCLQRALERPH